MSYSNVSSGVNDNVDPLNVRSAIPNDSNSEPSGLSILTCGVVGKIVSSNVTVNVIPLMAIPSASSSGSKLTTIGDDGSSVTKFQSSLPDVPAKALSDMSSTAPFTICTYSSVLSIKGSSGLIVSTDPSNITWSDVTSIVANAASLSYRRITMLPLPGLTASLNVTTRSWRTSTLVDSSAGESCTISGAVTSGSGVVVKFQS